MTDPAQRRRHPEPHHHRGSREEFRPGHRPDPHLPLRRRPRVRLDGAMGGAGSVITPFYDSLLTKLTVHGPNFDTAMRRMSRALREFRIRGVKTNIPFLENVLKQREVLQRPRQHAPDRRHPGAVSSSSRAATARPSCSTSSATSSSTRIPTRRATTRRPDPAGDPPAVRQDAGTRQRGRARSCSNSARKSSPSGCATNSAC